MVLSLARKQPVIQGKFQPQNHSEKPALHKKHDAVGHGIKSNRIGTEKGEPDEQVRLSLCFYLSCFRGTITFSENMPSFAENNA